MGLTDEAATEAPNEVDKFIDSFEGVLVFVGCGVVVVALVVGVAGWGVYSFSTGQFVASSSAAVVKPEPELTNVKSE